MIVISIISMWLPFIDFRVESRLKFMLLFIICWRGFSSGNELILSWQIFLINALLRLFRLSQGFLKLQVLQVLILNGHILVVSVSRSPPPAVQETFSQMELQSLLTGIFSPFYLSIVCQVCYVCIIIIIIVTTRIILLLLFHTIITIISLSTFSLSLVRSIMVIITIAIIMIMQLLALRIFFFLKRRQQSLSI